MRLIWLTFSEEAEESVGERKLAEGGREKEKKGKKERGSKLHGYLGEDKPRREKNGLGMLKGQQGARYMLEQMEQEKKSERLYSNVSGCDDKE